MTNIFALIFPPHGNGPLRYRKKKAKLLPGKSVVKLATQLFPHSPAFSSILRVVYILDLYSTCHFTHGNKMLHD